MPRLPEIFERDALPEEHRTVHDYLVKTRGAVSPGFASQLHSPEFVQRVAHLGTFVRFESSLPPALRELAAFTTSTELGNHYEQAIHGKTAGELGVSAEAIDAVLNQTSTEGAGGDEVLAIGAVREIVRNHGLSDATFNAARERLGEQGVVELIGTIGYYAMLACIHTSLDVQPPQA